MAKTVFDSSDVQKNKTIGALGYIFFFLPLILCPDSKYGRFCANQGLLSAIVFLLLKVVFGVLNALLGWLPLIGWSISTVGWLMQAAVALLAIYFFYLANWKGDARELPFIGQTRILK